MDGPIAAATVPPSALMPASMTPSRIPIRPACRTQTPGATPFARASAIGRQSAASASKASPDSSVHNPSPRRLAQTERGQVAAGHLEPDVAQAAEVVVQGLELREREREERRVGRVAVGERDCLRRLDVAVSKSLDDPRPDRDGGGDLLRIP